MTFGIVGEIYLRKLYLFAAMQFSYDGILKPQLLCFATSRLSISDLIENITGLLIPGIKALDIISIDYFDFECRNKFQMEWFEKTDLSQIAAFFNDNITASQLSIDVNTISIGRIPQDDGYALVDKYRMRHYYVDADGVCICVHNFIIQMWQNPSQLVTAWLSVREYSFVQKFVCFNCL